MKKIDKVPGGSKWDFVFSKFCHVRVAGNKRAFTYAELIDINCVGSVHKYKFCEYPDLLYYEYDFFDKQVILKTWGFGEDFAENRQQIALFYENEWWLREGSKFDWDPKFDPDGYVKSFKVMFKDSDKMIEVEVKP